MEVRFSPMGCEHIEAVVALEKKCGLSPRSAESYLQLIQNPQSILILALGEASHDKVFSVVAVFSGWVVADELQIDNIAVDESCRRNGIGSMLLTKALNEAGQKGAFNAFLEVRSDNLAARSLYEKAGFKVVGRRAGYYRNPLDDALTMSLDLVSSH